MKRTFFALFLLSVVSVSLLAQSRIKQISDSEFRKLVWNYAASTNVKLNSKLPVIIDFYATWCGPCKQLSPHLEKLQKDFAGKLIIYRVDVDKESTLAEKMGIQAMPTLMFFNTKNQKSVSVGYISYNELRKTTTQKLQIGK